MPIAYEGSEGIGHTGYTKYPAEGANVRKNGGNDAKHDHVVSQTSDPKSAYKQGSYGQSGPSGTNPKTE